MRICENNTVLAKSDFWSKTRQPAPVSPTSSCFPSAPTYKNQQGSDLSKVSPALSAQFVRVHSLVYSDSPNTCNIYMITTLDTSVSRAEKDSRFVQTTELNRAPSIGI